MPAFGDFWRNRSLGFWERMDTRTGSSPATMALVQAALSAQSVVEVGCGAGHLAELLFKNGYSGSYWGCDISKVATDKAASRVKGAEFVVGDFLELSQRNLVPDVDVVISRDAVQHQYHWMPMVMAMLAHAPVAGIAMTRPNYVDVHARRHQIRVADSYYDVKIAIPQLKLEAEAAGLEVEIHTGPPPWPREARGHEVSVLFRHVKSFISR